MIFIDRENELSFLEEKWSGDKPQLIVLWGKRRVGKTELVKQFTRSRPHIYFLAESTNEKEQLNRFSRAVGEFFNEPLLLTRGFASWEESLQYVKGKKTRIILAIDEFPYLIQSNKGITTVFQRAWDEHLSDSLVYLVLLGSSVGMMETEMLGYKAPLYGRRTGQWKLQPLKFASVSRFREKRSFDDKVMHFSLAGGIPAYWLHLSRDKDFLQNLKDHVLKKGEVFYDEAEFLLREELREPRYYFSLLQAVAQGKRKLSEIVNATGIPQPTANKYLGVLSDLDIVEREVPITEEKPAKSKKGLYRIKDEFFSFWFRFIFPRRGDLEMGHLERVLGDIRKGLPQHLSMIYERIAAETLWDNMSVFFPFDALGRWWDKNEEIDLVAINHEGRQILYSEVKWNNRPVGTDILEKLKSKAEKVIPDSEKWERHYALFSRKGFTPALLKLAKEEGITLFEGNKLIHP